MAQHQPIRKAHPKSGSDIPDKLYFRIGEVSKLCEVPAYVLRFWESEFPQLKPHKGGTGQRLYRRRDVETALHIKSLLYDEGYTIPGARQVIKSELRQKEPVTPRHRCPNAGRQSPATTQAPEGSPRSPRHTLEACNPRGNPYHPRPPPSGQRPPNPGEALRRTSRRLTQS
jgi:DNA-binding transcriptional MerR regulator